MERKKKSVAKPSCSTETCLNKSKDMWPSTGEGACAAGEQLTATRHLEDRPGDDAGMKRENEEEKKEIVGVRRAVKDESEEQ